MSDRTQDEVVTLDALRVAAKLIGDDEPWRGRDYEHNRAEFWRLVAKWALADFFIAGEPEEIKRLVAEIEART